ncbi:MAG: exodeoxyribonuclease III [Deltaproteobacteria bacterium]|nr:exodeoxyribonuclease III [Deltaproteobacteria bacterium]
MSLKLISWNVNGFRSALTKGLREFVAAEKPHLLCLQETKSDESVFADERFQIPGYSVHVSCAQKKGYSGVATWVRDGITPRSIECGIGVKSFDQEGRFVILRFKDFDLFNTYYPSGTTGEVRQAFKYKFLDALYEYLKGLSPQKRARIVMCGDFNICHREVDIHHPDTATKLELSGFLPAERMWMDKFEELGFIDTFRSVHGPDTKAYTWWSFRAGARGKNLGWRIDYIWAGKGLRSSIQHAHVYSSTAGSDHCPISVELNLQA